MAATVISDGTVLKTVRYCWCCSKCAGLFYCDTYDKDKRGSCAGGTVHELWLGELKVRDTGTGDSGFRFCRSCACVYLASTFPD